MHQSDRTLLRDLAKRYAAACTREVQQTRRDLWRRHNSLKPTPPLIYVRAFAWREMPESKCLCTDPFFRPYEDFFRRMLFVDTLDDDSIFEPWINVPAARRLPGGLWGLPLNWIASE